MAHSAYPELGDSAVHKLVRALDRLLDLELPHVEGIGSSTLNIGIIEGGRAPNVIADAASAAVLVRRVGALQETRRAIVQAVGGPAGVDGCWRKGWLRDCWCGAASGCLWPRQDSLRWFYRRSCSYPRVGWCAGEGFSSRRLGWLPSCRLTGAWGCCRFIISAIRTRSGLSFSARPISSWLPSPWWWYGCMPRWRSGGCGPFNCNRYGI